MKVETRTRRTKDEHGYEDIWTDIILIPETDAESRAIDLLGEGKIPTAVKGKIDLSDGYGEHYIILREAGRKDLEDEYEQRRD